MTVLRENRCELWLGDLLLTGDTDFGGDYFTIDALDEDATWGNPVPIDGAVQRWMTDGAVAFTQGHENREIYFKVLVSANSSIALAAGEAALASRANQSTTLTWVPPQGQPDAPASVFEVWTWHLEHEFDGGDERYLQRTYGVRITAKPWVRSVDLTYAPAPASPATSTTTLVDACTSTSGWTGTPGTLTVSGSSLQLSRNETVTTGHSGARTVTRTMTRTGSVTGLASLDYLLIDMSITGGSNDAFTVTLDDGTQLQQAAAIGTQRYYTFPTGMASFTKLVIQASTYVRKTRAVALTVNDIYKTDAIAPVGSPKQLARSVKIGGSVKTSGSVHVGSLSALGTVLVYTRPDDGSGYTPPMRQYRTDGNSVSVDTTCMSGARESLVTSGASAGFITYTIPAGRLPEGQYAVVSRLLFGSAATITLSMTAGFNTMTAKAIASGSGAKWVVLGTIALPGVQIPAESTVDSTILLNATADQGTHSLDELYLLDVTSGAYTLILSCPSAHLWLDAPDADPDRNRPALYFGAASDRSNASAVLPGNILSRGDHDFAPGLSLLFSVTSSVNNADVDVVAYRRWHTHAGS